MHDSNRRQRGKGGQCQITRSHLDRQCEESIATVSSNASFMKVVVLRYRTRPIRTYNTAVVYYHKFRLVHADNEYSFIVDQLFFFTMNFTNEREGCRSSGSVHSLQDRRYLEEIEGDSMRCLQFEAVASRAAQCR